MQTRKFWQRSMYGKIQKKIVASRCIFFIYVLSNIIFANFFLFFSVRNTNTLYFILHTLIIYTSIAM